VRKSGDGPVIVGALAILIMAAVIVHLVSVFL
jgi:hypothetical protein